MAIYGWGKILWKHFHNKKKTVLLAEENCVLYQGEVVKMNDILTLYPRKADLNKCAPSYS